MSWLNRLIARGMMRSIDLSSPRGLQEEKDTLRLWMLLHLRQKLIEEGHKGHQAMPREVLSGAVEEVWGSLKPPDIYDQQIFIQQQQNKQVIQLLDATSRIWDLLQQRRAYELRSPDKVVRYASVFRATENKVQSVLTDAVGFSLSVEKSSNPLAGQGVFLRGRALPGTVVALYPGTVFMPALLKDPEVQKHLTRNEERKMWLALRYDNVIIDAEPVAPPRPLPLNPFAYGHMINHPPKGGVANVMSFAYDFPLLKHSALEPEDELTRFPDKYESLIPNEYLERPRIDRDITMRSIALIATEEIENEELLLNYRLNPKLQRPDWYHPVDAEEENARWG